MSYQDWRGNRHPYDRNFQGNSGRFYPGHGGIQEHTTAHRPNYNNGPNNSRPYFRNPNSYSNTHPAYRNEPYRPSMNPRNSFNTNFWRPNKETFQNAFHGRPSSHRFDSDKSQSNHEHWEKPRYGPFKRSQHEDVFKNSSKKHFNQNTNIHKYFKESMLEDPWKDLEKDNLINDELKT